MATAKQVLTDIKNSNEPIRTPLYRAILTRVVKCNFLGVVNEISREDLKKWSKVIVFGVETKLEDDIVIIYSLMTDKLAFMWKSQAKHCLHYTTSLDELLSTQLQVYFNDKIKNANFK